MIQIIPRANRGTSRGERIGQALAGAGQAFGEMYPQYLQAQEDKKKALEDNRLFKSLAGHDLPNDQKARQSAMGLALQGKTLGQLDSKQQKLNQELGSFADTIVEGYPNSPQHNMFAELMRRDIPIQDKAAIFKALSGQDPFKSSQQDRLEKDMVRKLYANKISEIQQQLKTAKTYSPVKGQPSERDILLQQLAALQSERDAYFFGDQDDFQSYVEPFEDEIEDVEEIKPKKKPKKSPTIAFNPNKKEHRALAESLFKKHGDKEKVREILRKQFKGL